jgi:phosphoribosylanthranilate isomerase
VFVKICGITNEDDALLAVALGADALGFVFAPSRRQVNMETVRDIVKRVPREVLTIGVFRNDTPAHVVDVVARTGLHAAQLHGAEPRSEVQWVRERVRFVIQAFTAGDPALAAAANSPADVILVDSPDPGSGRVFDWRLAEGAPSGVRILLAGGLTPHNVGEAIRLVRPWGVDVASGVEVAPGSKDPRKLRRFIEAARAAGAELNAPAVDLRGFDSLDAEPRESRGVRQPAGDARPFDWQLDE